ncbi:tape measure protein [Mycobacterium sp. CBMA361]|nr:tape measure protein [Mycolicibacterium sp. CBMA 361]
MAAKQLASGYVSLSVKYASAMSQITKDVAGVEKAADKSGTRAGQLIRQGLTEGARQGGADSSKSIGQNLSEGLGARIGEKFGMAISRPITAIMGRAGDEAGENFSKHMEASASKSASKAGKSSGSGFAAGLLGSLKIPALAVGGAITGGIGYAVTKGIARLTAIDDAKAKLIGLGHDAQSVTQIMDSATAAVKGTSFGLDEAATAAATAVAAGVKPGEELTKYLTGIADAAAIAGTPLEEMAPIFNKVTTNGKAMTGELQQLSDRGLPIFQWLQDEYKVSGEQLSKMVSDGKVDAATFQKVVSANIGGAAQKMGNSTSGALKNMNAAIGRFGAALVAPVFNKAAGVFTFLTGAVDNATKAIGPLLERIGLQRPDHAVRTVGDPACEGVLRRLPAVHPVLQLCSHQRRRRRQGCIAEGARCPQDRRHDRDRRLQEPRYGTAALRLSPDRRRPVGIPGHGRAAGQDCPEAGTAGRFDRQGLQRPHACRQVRRHGAGQRPGRHRQGRHLGLASRSARDHLGSHLDSRQARWPDRLADRDGLPGYRRLLQGRRRSRNVVVEQRHCPGLRRHQGRDRYCLAGNPGCPHPVQARLRGHQLRREAGMGCDPDRLPRNGSRLQRRRPGRLRPLAAIHGARVGRHQERHQRRLGVHLARLGRHQDRRTCGR